jgi:hypothetical protein
MPPAATSIGDGGIGDGTPEEVAGRSCGWSIAGGGTGSGCDAVGAGAGTFGDGNDDIGPVRSAMETGSNTASRIPLRCTVGTSLL